MPHVPHQLYAPPEPTPAGTASPPLTRNPYELLEQADSLHATIAGLQSALEHHERLATLGTIAGLIAHEFNNILTPVLSYAQMALARPDDRALAQKALVRAVEGTERAAAISSAILGFVRDDSGADRRRGSRTSGQDRDDGGDVPRGTPDDRRAEHGRCDVDAAIHDALACLARDPARDGIEVEISVEPGLSAEIRPIALQHVMLNLLLNARKAMLPAGGTLTIRGYRRASAPDLRDGDAVGVAPGGEPAPAWVEIEVRDSGCGMTAEDLARLFRPFYTATPHNRGNRLRASATVEGTSEGSGDRRSGTGLGMTICARLIADSGGVLLARSRVGEGTSVIIGLRAA